MSREFDALVDALKQSRKKCPWAREVITKEHIERLKDEVHELTEAVASNDKQHIREELVVHIETVRKFIWCKERIGELFAEF